MLSRDQILASMRERVHHPAGVRELLQLLKVPRDERTTFKRHINALVASGDLIQIRGQRFGLPEKMDLYVGRLQTHPGGYAVIPGALSKAAAISISGPLLNEAMRRSRRRPHRTGQGRRARRRPNHRDPRAATRGSSAVRPRGEDGMGYVVPFDPRVLMDIFVPRARRAGLAG
jgi:ribonuclease R